MADRWFVNGEFPGRTLLVRDGRVAAVGASPPAGARVIDLQGHVVRPGFFDSHLHLLALGLSLGRVDLAGVSLAEGLAAIGAAARALPPGAWVAGRGWDQGRLGRYLSREDLDQAAAGRPCLLYRVCGHVAAASSRALELAGITEATPDPAGGRIDRDLAGRPTGILRETAIGQVAAAMPDPGPAELRLALERAIRHVLACGITTVRVDDVGAAGGLTAACDLYRETVGPQGLPLRVILDVSDRALDELEAAPPAGDDWFRTGAVKIFADGSLGAATAALEEPYADDPGNRGIAITAGEELDRLVARVHRSGRQVAIHAIGDRAAANALDAIERAQGADPRPDPRHRLVHCQVLTASLVRRMAALGVVADIQPVFVATDHHWAGDRLGPRRLDYAYAWRSLLDAGISLAGGSDAPIEPVNPFFGLHAAVTRQDRAGHPPGGWLPAEKLTVGKALHLYTQGGPYAAFEEHRKGSLDTGKLADFVVLPADPARVDPSALKEMLPLMTVVGGRVAHATGPFPGAA
ncbi:MAG: amidohydrolase [bacterium]|nr:amidohydrolase [bacterium]